MLVEPFAFERKVAVGVEIADACLRLELMLVEPFAFERKVAVGVDMMPVDNRPSTRIVGLLGVISYRNRSVDHCPVA